MGLFIPLAFSHQRRNFSLSLEKFPDHWMFSKNVHSIVKYVEPMMRCTLRTICGFLCISTVFLYSYDIGLACTCLHCAVFCSRSSLFGMKCFWLIVSMRIIFIVGVHKHIMLLSCCWPVSRIIMEKRFDGFHN